MTCVYWQITMKHLRENIFSVFFSVSQGSAEALIRWGGKV